MHSEMFSRPATTDDLAAKMCSFNFFPNINKISSIPWLKIMTKKWEGVKKPGGN